MPYNLADFCIARFGNPLQVYDPRAKGDGDHYRLARLIKYILQGEFHPVQPSFLAHLPTSRECSTDWMIAVPTTQPVNHYHKRAINNVCNSFFKETLYTELLYIQKPSLAQKVDYFIQKYRLTHENAHDHIVALYKTRRAAIQHATAHLNPIDHAKS